MQDIVKHIVTGGFWVDPKTKRWVSAGKDIIDYMDNHPNQRHLLGFHTIQLKPAGRLKILILPRLFIFISSALYLGSSHLPTQQNT